MRKLDTSQTHETSDTRGPRDPCGTNETHQTCEIDVNN